MMATMAKPKVTRPRAGRHPNQRPAALPPGPAAAPRWLATADAVALLAFVVTGMRTHHEAGAATIFLRNAIPLLGTWFVVAALFRTYRRPGFVVVLKTWIVAVPIGLVLRSLWVGSPEGLRILVFLAVGLAFTLLFLLLGRAAVVVITGRGYPGRRRDQ
jgi:hypothetical protein